MKKILMCFIFLGIVLFNIIPSCKAELPANKIYDQKVNSILYIETQDSRGSGIILKEDGTFVTCFHVIANADYINVKTKDGSKYKVNGYKYINIKDDVAILTLATTKKFTPITINNDPKIGDTVYTIANPQGLQFVFSNGMVNQFDNEKIQYSAPSSPGSSGGALLNKNGELIGMVASQYDLKEAQNINFAIRTNYFLPYIDKKKKLNSKKQSWANFMLGNLSEKELDIFKEYALKDKKMSMLYKYIQSTTNHDNMESFEYAFNGTLALLGILDERDYNKETIREAMKWYALAITSNENVELASSGLVVAYFMCLDDKNNDLYIYDDYLKKYPRSRKIIVKSLLAIANNKEDDNCIDEQITKISKYLKYLMYKTYFNN